MRFPSFNITLYLKIVCPDIFFRNCTSVINKVAPCSISSVVLSKSTVNCHRKKHCQELAHQIQKNISSKSIVYWDGKLLHDVTGYISHKID